MRKYFSITIVIILVIGIFVVVKNSQKATTNAQSSEVLGTAETAIMSQTPTVSITITEVLATVTTTPTATAAPAFSCSSIANELKKKANAFMNAHQNKSITILSLMTQAELDDDAQQYAYLMGYDIDSDPRLYATAQMAYTTKSFSFGNISSAGQDMVIRGNDLCLLPVFEVRQSKAQEQYSEETVTRYLEFTVSPDTSNQLAGFKDGKNSTKYSGFN